MLTHLLSRFENVHRATTPEEKEAVYRFRYEVYAEEFGRELGSPDHEQRIVRDADDDRSTTTILYTGTPDHITGTVRIRHWAPGHVPHHDFDELSMDLIPGVERLGTGEIGRLMVKRGMRGKLIVASLVRASYEVFVGEHATDLVFCYCSPGLVDYYRSIAMRAFGGRMIHAPDGVMIPLLAVTSDVAYYRQERSFLMPLVRRYFGPGKRSRLDLEPFLPLFENGNGIETKAEIVASTATAALFSTQAGASSSNFLLQLPEDARDALLRRGFLLDVPSGTLMTREGFAETELYLVLDGDFEAEAGGFDCGTIRRGEIFGEDGFLSTDHRRRLSVRARRDSRVLVLRGRSIEKLARREPRIGTLLHTHLSELSMARGAGAVAA